MPKTLLIVAILALFAIVLIFVFGKSNNTSKQTTQAEKNIEIKDGIQYITVTAKAGYSPKVTNAKANIPTKLVVKTNGTYDCSASLIVRPTGFRGILSQTGEKVIDLGIPKSDQPVLGICGMGMYSFQINFS